MRSFCSTRPSQGLSCGRFLETRDNGPPLQRFASPLKEENAVASNNINAKALLSPKPSFLGTKFVISPHPPAQENWHVHVLYSYFKRILSRFCACSGSQKLNLCSGPEQSQFLRFCAAKCRRLILS